MISQGEDKFPLMPSDRQSLLQPNGKASLYGESIMIAATEAQHIVNASPKNTLLGVQAYPISWDNDNNSPISIIRPASSGRAQATYVPETSTGKVTYEPLAEFDEVEEPDYPPEEAMLKTGFAGVLAKIDVSSIVHLLPGRDMPKSIGDYRLVPITSTNVSASTIDSTGQRCGWRPHDDVVSNYRGFGGKPFLDASLAIGLVYRDVIAAVAAAGIDNRGRLKIVQIQDITKKDPDDPRSRFKSGLHGGFYWRDTLVEAWMSVARELGIQEVEIQSAKNNQWNRSHDYPRKQQLKTAYDTLAERMGCILSQETANWRVPARAQ